MASDTAWCQLVSLTDFESEPIFVEGETFSIGRSADCDLSMSDNKLVSGRHCYIERSVDGKVTLNDTSTNGTLLNMTYKVTKGQSKELKHGDEFYIVYKKEREDANVGFIYQDLAELAAEEGTQEYSPPELMDATLEDIDCNYITPEKVEKKRKSEEGTSGEDIPIKKQKTEAAESVTDKTKDKEVKDGDKTNSDTGKGTKDAPEQGKPGEGKPEAADSDKVVAAKSSVPERDDIEENLQCMICQEIMHNCISLQPCLHSFCAGCYSDWMSRSQECPSCRKKVRRINKNHIVNNLIEAYLKEHPDKKRPEEDLAELNQKNKVTKDMLYPKDQLEDYYSSEYSDTDGDDDEADPTPAPYNPPVVIPPPAPAPALFGFGTPVFGVSRAYKTVCRQCPEYKDPWTSNISNTGNTGIVGGIKTAINTVKNLVTGGEDAAGDGPSTSGEGTDGDGKGDPVASGSGEAAPARPGGHRDDVKVMPTPHTHVCPANQNHVLCQCCVQPMPDFRYLRMSQPDLPPQQCEICYRAFCNAYWGCKKGDCLGCLAIFKEMHFGRKALVGLILDNQTESEIFRDYIDSKGLLVMDVLQECCRQMDAGIFTPPVRGGGRFTSKTIVCYACGMTCFKELAFQFRKTVKKEDLPAEAKTRPDCYWGSKCRTQKNKPHHAQKFNHVCEQTRQY